MTKEKEAGYDLINVLWHNIDGFEKLWNSTEIPTKEMVVKAVGKLAFITIKQELNQSQNVVT